MRTYTQDGEDYRVPGGLSSYQLSMYVHLINWKWKHLTREPGYFKGRPYDALLPADLKNRLLPIHSSISERVQSHRGRFPFKLHKFIGHMASSQAACANLFVPLLEHPAEAADVLRAVKPDLGSIAVEMMDSGFRLEFWDEPDNALNDHNEVSGTDSDIAIAYFTQQGDLRLWLIEHKLTEPDFTTCGGYRSRARNKATHRCDSLDGLLANHSLCYYDGVSNYRYWAITRARPDAFPEHSLRRFAGCPFQGGLNQLWRNQLLALAIESSRSEHWPYEQVHFSVVYHPGNIALKPTIDRFRDILGDAGRFSSFSSDTLVSRASQLGFEPFRMWVDWYRELYFF